VGVQHNAVEGDKEEKYEFGRFNFYFWHQASSANTVGTEFIWNLKQTEKKEPPVEIKFGL